MQVVLSQRMTKPFAASPPMALYRSLRSLNPSPYMFYFDFEGFPRRRRLTRNPRPPRRRYRHRPADRRHPQARRLPDEDAALAADLLADEKERPSTPSSSTSAATTAAASPGWGRSSSPRT